MFSDSKKIVLIKNIILLSIFILLFLIPFIFWGDAKIVGGDDGRLYYLYPLEYLNNFATKMISNNSLGGLGEYFPQMYILGFTIIISFLQLITFNIFNLQAISLGLVLSLGFLGFYKFIGIWIKSIKIEDIGVKILGSVLYIFSTFTFITVWNSLLFAVYLVAIMPWIFYLIMKSIQTDKIIYVIWAAIIISIFSIGILSLAWFIAMLIAIFPIFVFQFINKPKITIKMSAFFIVITILLNIHWGFHLINSFSSKNSSNGDVSAVINSDDFKNQNVNTIKVVSDSNSLIYPMFNLFHYGIQKDFNWTTLHVYENWHIKTLYSQGILVIIVILGFIVKKTDKLQVLISIRNFTFVSWIVLLWLFTVKIENWGLNLFLYFNQHIPGFTLFRNMFDKFGLALAFIYALLVVISLATLYKSNINRYIVNILAVLVLIVTVFNAIPFIKGDYYKNPIWTTENIYPRLNNFNDDFISLNNYIKDIDTKGGRFLWTPLNKAGYVISQDRDISNYYYVGVSPLQVLTKQQDYAGTLSFKNFDSLIQEYLYEDKYNELMLLFQKMNIKYVIVNKDIPLELQESYLYSSKVKGDLYEFQNKDEYLKILLGEKIKDFGNKYSLYKINYNYLSEKVIISDDADKLASDKDAVFYRDNATEYRVEISNVKNVNYYISFLDPFQSEWEMIEQNTNYKISNHKQIFDYANQWTITSEDIDNISKNPNYKGKLEFKIYFRPAQYQYILYIISGTTLILCLGYLGYAFYRKRGGQE